MRQKSDITRRGFLRLAGAGGAGLVGVGIVGLPGFEKLLAAAVSDIPVVWLQAGSCAGCSVSLLNTVSPTIQDLLLGEVIPGQHVSLAFHPNVSAGQGEQVTQLLLDYAGGKKGKFVLVVEGGVSTRDNGIYCEMGEVDGHGITALKHVTDLAPRALAVINIGTCSAYGGIPAAAPNPTDIKPVGEILRLAGVSTPVVNVPGCPAHPDWFVGTVATVLIGGIGALDVDALGRPKAFYGQRIHDNCQLRGHFDKGEFARDFSDKGCLYRLGCKGPVAFADCPHRGWNSGANWCIGSGSPCIGCVQPEFPYEQSLLATVDLHEVTPPDTYPPIAAEHDNGVASGLVGVAGAAIGVAVGVGLASSRKKARAADKGSAKEETHDS